MSMIPCPGCGLPRIEDQLNTVPCPVCAATPATAASRPIAKGLPAPDPTAGLPSDVSELHAAAASTAAGSRLFVWVIVFLLGVGTGVGGLLGWQILSAPKTLPRDPRLDTAETTPTPEPQPPNSVPIAPVQPQLRPPEPAETSTSAVSPPRPSPPQPEPKPATPLEGAVVRDLGEQPDGTFTAPVMKKGERLILKGKIQTLRVIGLDGGAVLDASGLEAATIYVGGKIDGQSVLKLYAPGGVVTVAAPVGGKSSIEIMAPGGIVNFPIQTAVTRPGSTIDGGSQVTITGRTVDLRGDVNGIETKVRVNLPHMGVLKVAVVRGIATVEYHVADGNGMPDVTVGAVSPTATFKKVE
jgi:hypothetical protein